MSKSLYEISDELSQIINTIEENGGEIDEFTEEALAIKQEELESKIESYCNVITMTKSDIECCKNEKQRINSIQNVKKNIIDKLKERMLDAVLKWGDTGKSGNKVLNLATHKLFTKSSHKLKLDDERVETLTHYVKNYISELKKEGILVTGQEIDLTGMIAAINAIIRSEKGQDYRPFKLSDLNFVKLNISTEVSFISLLDGSHDFAIDAMFSPNASVSTEADNNGIEKALSVAEDYDIEPTTTLGSVTDEYSLTIK